MKVVAISPTYNECDNIENLISKLDIIYANTDVKEIIITASGGPFLNIPNNKLKKITPKQAIKHPNWKMGKKISVDSANLMNKVFEIIEACKIFNFEEKKYRIMINPQSYFH